MFPPPSFVTSLHRSSFFVRNYGKSFDWGKNVTSLKSAFGKTARLQKGKQMNTLACVIMNRHIMNVKIFKQKHHRMGLRGLTFFTSLSDTQLLSTKIVTRAPLNLTRILCFQIKDVGYNVEEVAVGGIFVVYVTVVVFNRDCSIFVYSLSQ